VSAASLVETMRREGHTALVHTAAASNLGQMLNRICLKDKIGLVNIVRSAKQEDMLRAQGAFYVWPLTTVSAQRLEPEESDRSAATRYPHF
jgi:NADPH2:quinone reductase